MVKCFWLGATGALEHSNNDGNAATTCEEDEKYRTKATSTVKQIYILLVEFDYIYIH